MEKIMPNEITVDGPEMASVDSGEAGREVNYVLDLFAEYSASTYRKKKIDDAEKCRKDYDGERDTKDFPWENCANYSLMVPAIVLDNLEPRLSSAVCGKDRDIIEVIPNSKAGMDYVDDMGDFSEWALAHNIKWQQDAPMWIHDLLLDGTVYIFPHYEEMTLKRGERFVGDVPIDPYDQRRLDEADIMAYQIEKKPVDKKRVDEIAFKDKKIFRVVNECALINEIYGPDIVTDWDKTPTLRKQFVKYEDLLAQSGANGPYINITDDLKAGAGNVRTDEDLPPGSDRDQAQPERLNPDIEILTAYCMYELEEGDRDWCILTVAMQTSTLIRKQYVRDVYYSLVGKPCKRLIIFPDAGKQYGTSVVYKVRHFTAAMNDLLNQMIDAGTIGNNPWFFYGYDAGMPDELDISPGGANPIVGNAQSIVWPNINAKPEALINFINLLTSFLERLIAVSSYNAGVENINMGQGAGTAAGMRMILQEAQVKHTYQAKPLKEQLEEVIKLDMMLYSWYIPDGFEFILPSSNILKKITVTALQQEYDFSLRISDSAYNRLMARTENAELLQMATNLPFAQAIEIYKDLLNSYDKKNTDKYINPNFAATIQILSQFPEAAKVLQQYIQQKMEEQHNEQLGQVAKDGVTVGKMKEKLQEPGLMQDLMKTVQKSMTKKKIQEDIEFEAALKNKKLVSKKDMLDAEAAKSRRLAHDLVEGAID